MSWCLVVVNLCQGGRVRHETEMSFVCLCDSHVQCLETPCFVHRGRLEVALLSVLVVLSLFVFLTTCKMWSARQLLLSTSFVIELFVSSAVHLLIHLVPFKNRLGCWKLPDCSE